MRCSLPWWVSYVLLLAAMTGAAAAGVPRNGSSPAPDKPPAEPQLVTPEEEAEREASSFLAIFVCLVLLVTGTLATYALRRAKVPVPESWVYVALGSLLSTIIYSGASEQLKLIRETLHDSFSVIFFAALLPVIIFESGYSMHKKSFFTHFGSICIFAFLGTLLSALVVSVFMWMCGMLGMGYKWTFLDATIFGSIVSATDPVTVLAVFTSLKVDRRLYSLVFGESVLNDAVAIVMFHTLLAFHGSTEVTFGTVSWGFFSFVTVFCGSVLLGIVVAVLASLLFKHAFTASEAGDTGVQRVLITILPFISYMLAEGLQLSGVVAILFAGMGMAQYTQPNLAPSARHFSLRLFKMAAEVCEALVFIYIGLALPKLFSTALLSAWGTLTLALVACLVARAANVALCTAAVNAQYPSHDPRHIPNETAFVIWFSGLRGGVSFALAQLTRGIVPDEKAAILMEGAALFIVVATLLGIGGGIAPLVKHFRLSRADRRQSGGSYHAVGTAEAAEAQGDEPAAEAQEASSDGASDASRSRTPRQHRPLSVGSDGAASPLPRPPSNAPSQPPQPDDAGSPSKDRNLQPEGSGSVPPAAQSPEPNAWQRLDRHFLSPMFLRSGVAEPGTRDSSDTAQLPAV